MMSTMKKTKINKLLITLFLALVLMSASFIGYNLNFNNTMEVSASKIEQTSLISNSNLTTSGTGLQTSISGWTVTGDTVIKDRITHGMINVYSNNFTDDKQELYNLTENPGIPSLILPENSTSNEYYHLMINSKSKDDTQDIASRLGYKTSSNFTLNKGSYYSIAVTLKTTGNARASVYLEGLSDKSQNSKFVNVKTSDTWQTYTLYVSTNSINTESGLSLELWLGEKEASGQTYTGAVFFNSIKVHKYSEKEFTQELHYASTYNNYLDNIKTIELNQPFNPALQLANNSFQNYSLDNYEVLESFDNNYAPRVVPTNNYNATIHTNEGISNPLTNGSANDDNVLFMMNEKETSYQGLKTGAINIKRDSFYKVSVWANSDSNLGTGATLILTEAKTSQNENNIQSAKLTVAKTETSNPSTNNWSEYTFYVKGNSLNDVNVYLELWLGTKETPTNGYVFFDEIKIQEITYNNYTNGSSATNSATLNLSNNQSSFLNTNGNFNTKNGLVENHFNVYNPEGWTLTSEEFYSPGKNASGIINTQTTDFNDYILNNELDATDNPGLTPLLTHVGSSNLNNNILAVHNQTITTQKFSSNSVNLSAKSYYQVTFSVYTAINTELTNGGVSLSVINKDSGRVFEIKNINTSYGWKEYTVYIHTAEKTINAVLELALENTNGYAFFDNVNLITSSKPVFDAVKKNINSQTFIVNLNLGEEMFNNYTYNTNLTLNTPFNWVIENENSYIDAGVLNTNLISGASTPNPVNGSNMLYVNTKGEDAFVKLTSNTTTALNANQNYKITIKVKTTNLSQEEINKQYTEENELIPFGATISLTAFAENKFTAVNTETVTDNTANNWVDYTFYINPTSSVTTGVELTLGSENALTSGQMYVDSIIIEEITSEEFTTQTSNIENNETIIKLTQTTPDGETPDPSPEDGSDSEFTPFKFDGVLISSLILFASIILAIFGVLIRKIDFSKAPKVNTTYDRRKTLEVDVNKREQLQIRKSELSQLKSELKELDNETKDLLKDINSQKELELQSIENKKIALTEKQKEIKETINNLTKEFEAEQLSLTDEKAKQSSKNKYDKTVRKLNKESNKLELFKNSKTIKLRELEEKETQINNKQNYKRQLIEQEIEKFEIEISKLTNTKHTKSEVNTTPQTETEVEIEEVEPEVLEESEVVEVVENEETTESEKLDEDKNISESENSVNDNNSTNN